MISLIAIWISLIVMVVVWSQRAVQAARCQPACLNFTLSEPRNTLIILCNMWPFDSGKQKQRESCYATRQAAAEPRSPRTGNFYKQELFWKIQTGRILWLFQFFCLSSSSFWIYLVSVGEGSQKCCLRCRLAACFGSSKTMGIWLWWQWHSVRAADKGL